MGKNKRQVVDAEGSADFRNLPDVPIADDLIDAAFRRGSKASAPKGGPGQAGKNRELARVGTAARTIESRLHRVIRAFPSLETLHPFYRELVDVLVGLDQLRKSLGAIDWARKQVQDVRAKTEKKIRASTNDDEAHKARTAAYGRYASFVNQVSSDLAFVKQACISLRNLPTLKFDRPVLVVAGYPNVGKSSFLGHVSRAEPEVASYPFTTKGVNLGHVQLRHALVQVMDTPGLLDRPIERRNEIERQAIFALDHAADAILFMLDPSGHCGYPIEAQENLLAEVREQFGETPIMVVENKSDLKATGEHPAMSCENEEGIEAVLDQALELAWEAFQERWEPEIREF